MKQATVCVLLAALLAVGGSALAEGKTFLYFNSQPGDFVARGLEFTLTPSDGTITTSRVDGGVLVRYTSGDSWWMLAFVPPAGTDLTPGAYEWTMRWRVQSPTMGGLDVGGDGRGCNTLIGRFTVFEAEYDGAGEVRKLAIDYEQHCEGASAALFGSVRIDSDLPLGPRLAVGPARRYEGDGEEATLLFFVTLSAPADVPVTVRYQTVDGTATAGSDYAAVSGTETFAAGETRKQVFVPLLGDVEEEADESLTFALSEPAGAPIAFGRGLGTIVNDDPYRSYFYFDDRLVQGRQFSVTPVEGNITLQRVDGAIHADFDGFQDYWLRFGPPAGSTLVPGGYVMATRYPSRSPTTPGLDVTWNYSGWGGLEGQFVVLEAEYGPEGEVLRFAVDWELHGAKVAPAQFGSVRYRSSVPRRPRLFVGSAVATEEDDGSSDMRFVVALSEPAGVPVTVRYETLDGTARAGTDYDSAAGTVTFEPGQTAIPVTVTIHGDLAEEGDESLTLSLRNAVGAEIAFDEGEGKIFDDDPYKTLLHFDSEAGDNVGMGLRSTRTREDGGIVAYRVDDGVHIALESEQGWDLYFSPPAGWPLVPGEYPGATRWMHGPMRLPGLSAFGEGRGCSFVDGRFSVLEAEYGADGEVVRFAADFEQHCERMAPALYGFVRFNSSVPVVPRLAVDPASRFEGNDGSRVLTFEISLSAPAETVVTVDYRTVDGSATAGRDYEAVAGTATIPVGERRATVPVKVFGDVAPEGDETFALLLSNGAGAPIHLARGTGTILDDDGVLPKTFLYFDSPPGESMGGGRRFTLTPEDGAIDAEPFGRGVRVSFGGAGLWDLRFEPPAGDTLRVGVYEGAKLHARPGAPGLDVAGNGWWCYEVAGRFKILEIGYGAGGEVARFAADYVQSCESLGPALRGSVRFRSRVPRVQRAWAGDLTVTENDASTTRPGLEDTARPGHDDPSTRASGRSLQPAESKGVRPLRRTIP